MTDLEGLCIEIGNRLSRLPKDMHVSAVFDDNDSDLVIGWTLLYNDTNKSVYEDNDGKMMVFGIEEIFNLFE